ncbi:MAG: zinc-binding dehydrogenase [Solirubrobacteraceae bacterium]
MADVAVTTAPGAMADEHPPAMERPDFQVIPRAGLPIVGVVLLAAIVGIAVNETWPLTDAIVEGVGGATLGAAMQRVASFGAIVSFASSDTDPVQFPTRAFFGRAPGARLHGFYLFGVLAREPTGTEDLERLAGLVEQGRLECSIDHEGSWRDAAEAVEALLDRRIAGKAVLRVD